MLRRLHSFALAIPSSVGIAIILMYETWRVVRGQII